VGNGQTMYVPAGHENDELLAPGTSFDGGTGDYDRYVAQSLFFLAGYNASVCDASCNGLALVDNNNRIIGTYNSTGILHPGRMGFVFTGDGPFQAVVTDVRGREMMRKSGSGKLEHLFPTAGLKPGVYFLSLKVGSGPASIRKYLVSAGR
jgi:hypothetical protein